ncbi:MULTISPECIES: hypothetical protein [unclassified Bacillus (in: firmicutes)]|uniref:hypothetical protein n=1 Tax=unclassified Bacillus (in: firmicutes) TaxID=185979 RepID=UPI000BF0A50B|nr:MULTISPECIES: hypothetical protein [unclassified Bacillus (in: firmicutes)]PEJ56140.1 hypothetical protein CN692_18805 [Bacillus sp. AFS002410]PEK98339.1 hypothetical protein CN601_25870 [Bacillus sp. AFS017336]
MKKIVIVICTFLTCLCVNIIFFELTGLKKTNAMQNVAPKNVAKNEVSINKNINILKLPLPNSEQVKYSVEKLPINFNKVEIKKLNSK